MKLKLIIIGIVILTMATTATNANIVDDLIDFFSLGDSIQIEYDLIQSNKIQIQTGEPRWVQRTADGEFTVDISEKNTQKTEICFWSKTATRVQDLDNKRDLLDNEGNVIEQLNRKQERKGDDDKFGYCRLIDTEEYIKLNPEVEWLPEAFYNFSSNGFEGITTIKKDVHGNGTFSSPVDEILLATYDTGKWSLKANDTAETNESWNRYQFNHTFNVPIQNLNGKYYAVNGELGLEIDSTDICSQVHPITNATADCDFEVIEFVNEQNESRYSLLVSFWSTSFIDPSYSFEIIQNNLFLTNTAFEGNNVTHLEIANTTAPYDSLIAYWSFDDGFGQGQNYKAYDMSANNNDIVQITNANNQIHYNNSASDSIYNAFIDLDGSNDYLNIPTTPSMNFTQVTICGWYYAEVIPSEPGFFQKTTGLASSQFAGNIYLYEATNVNWAGAGVTLNEWTHLCWADNQTQVTLYRNGTSQGAKTSPARRYPTSDFQIGVYAATSWNGRIDEFMIFNTQLNSQQILDIYNNQSARFKSSGTVEIKPYLNQTDVTANRVNMTINNIECLFNTSCKLSVATWNASNGYNNTDLNGLNGLVAYYHADGNANDAMGIHHATLENGTTASTAGVFNNTFSFDGIDDYIDTPDNSAWNTRGNFSFWSNDTFSLALWYKGTDTAQNGANGKVLLGRDNGDIYANFVLRSGYVEFIHYNGGWQHNIKSTTLVADGNWHHIVYANKANKQGDLYIDGIKEIDSLSSTIQDNAYYTISSFAKGYNGVYTNGSMDEIMIFNRTITSTEVKELYVKGRANWNISTAVNITKTNSTFGTAKEINITSSSVIRPIVTYASTGFYTPLGGRPLNLQLTTEPYFELGDTPPTINITTPLNNSFLLGSTVNVTTNAEDDIGIDTINLTFINATDNTHFQVNTSTKNFTDIFDIGEGSWLIYACANDTLGQEVCTGNWSLLLDATPPFVTFDTLTQEDTINLSVNYYASNVTVVETNESNITWYFYNGSGELYANTTYSDKTREHNQTNFPEGNYTIEVKVIDLAGGEGTSGNRSFTIDTTNPSIDFIKPENNSINNTDYTFNATATDNLGIQRIEFWVDDVLDQTTYYANYVVSTDSQFSKSLADGVHTWFFKVFDWSGNSEVEGNRTITIDKTNPIVSLVSPTTDNGTQPVFWNNITINVSVTDVNPLNITAFLYNETALVNETVVNDTNLYLEYLNLSLGYFYYINATACDNATNCADTATQTIKLIQDETPPYYSNVIEPTDPTTYAPNTKYQFNITWVDELNPINDSLITFNALTYNMTQSGNISNWTISDLGVGVYSYNLTANDTVGNVNESETFTFTVSQATSEVNITINGSTQNITSEVGEVVNISGILLNGMGNIQVYQDSTLIANTTSPTFNQSNYTTVGLRNITVIYLENINYTYSNISATINVTDTTKPSLTINTPTAGNKTYQNIFVNITSSDILLYTTWFYNSTGNQTYTTPVNITLADGNYTFEMYANDTSGNIQNKNVSFTIDTTAPNITIINPTDGSSTTSTILTLNANATDVGVGVNQSSWLYSKNGAANLTLTPAVTDVLFSVGTHTLDFWVMDNIGHWSNVQSNFTVTTASGGGLTNFVRMTVTPKGQTYEQGETVITSATLSNANGSILSGHNITLFTYYPNGTEWFNTNLTEIGTSGFYSYSFGTTLEPTGSYNLYFNHTAVIETGSFNLVLNTTSSDNTTSILLNQNSTLTSLYNCLIKGIGCYGGAFGYNNIALLTEGGSLN